jgi:hypothetical protein
MHKRGTRSFWSSVVGGAHRAGAEGRGAGLVGLLASLASLAGCVPPVPQDKLVTSQLGAHPAGHVQWSGTLDFDIVGDVAGKGCYNVRDASHNLGYAEGRDMPEYGAVALATQAALFDALGKASASGADSVIITWSRAMISPGEYCGEVVGKAIKVTKGKTLDVAKLPPPPAPPAPAPAPAVPAKGGGR